MNRKLGPDAFSFYMSLGPSRSYDAVAKEFDVSKRAITSLAAREKWQERVAEIEAKARKSTDEKALETLEEMNLRHLKLARFMQSKGIEALRSMAINTSADAVRAINTGIETERLIRGEPTERTETSIEEITKQEMRDLLEIVDDDDEDGEGQQDEAL